MSVTAQLIDLLGLPNLTAYGPMYADANKNAANLGAGTARQLLVSGGAGVIPAWTTETWAAPGASGNILQSDGTNWTAATNNGGWTSVKVAGSDFTSSSTSLVDITGLSFAAAASTTYEIIISLDCSSSSTAGINFGMHSTGGSPTVYLNAVGPCAGTNPGAGQTLADNTAIAVVDLNGVGSSSWLTTAAAEGCVNIWGIVKSGTGSPTISVRGLKKTSGTLTVKVGSKLSYRVQ